MPKYLVFGNEWMKEAIDSSELTWDNWSGDMRHRIYHAKNRKKAVKKYVNDERKYLKSIKMMEGIYSPILSYLVDSIDCGDLNECHAKTDKFKKLISEIKEKIEKARSENDETVSDDLISDTVMSQYDPFVLEKILTKKEIKKLYYKAMRYEFSVLKIDE